MAIMKLRQIFSLFGFILISLFANAQSADEIIINFFNYSGGIENWRALNGMMVNSVVNDQGMDIPSTKIYLKDGRVLIQFELQDKKMTQVAFDGKVVWGDDFITMEPVKTDKDVTENMLREANDFPNPLLNYKKNGYTVSLEENDSIGDQACYKICLTKKKHLIKGQEVDNIEYYYISTTNFSLLAVESMIQAGQLKGKRRRDIFRMYKEVDGFLLPFVIKREIEGGGSMVIKIESIEINPEIDNSIFEFPDKK
jgi:outer membrane lipoprotein-sorting protein